MHEGKLIETANVRECWRQIGALKNRPKQDFVGLGMFYGKTGLGKTTVGARLAHKYGYMYQRLLSTSTKKSALASLYGVLSQCYLGRVMPAKGSANKLFGMCCRLLEDHEDAVIFIDEMNYALKKPDLLDTIRDIVDETLAIVILIGEEDAKERLLQHSRRYFSRCNAIYEFNPLTKTDVREVCTELLELPFDATVAEWVYTRTGGINFRDVIKLVRGLEGLAAHKGAANLTLSHCAELAAILDKK